MANAQGPAGGEGPITGQWYGVKRNLWDRSRATVREAGTRTGGVT
ncbi:hypothetical protein SAMN04487981_107420 [Streptomyces sp. cf386]|nr:hypothetical protein SAMN04487981_107420 [Streptomyces sp. cf386]